MTDVKMPQLGETVADGTVTKWLKNLGDMVTKGEPLFEVSTDKVDTEIPAPANGVLSQILVNEGETVDVGTVLAVIGGGADEHVEVAASSTSGTSSSTKKVGAPTTSAKSTSTEEHSQLSPVVRRLIEENGLDASTISGTGPNGRITRQDALSFIELAASTSTTSPGTSQSPIVRRLIRDNNIDLRTVAGTGPNGTITRSDVESRISASVQSATVPVEGDEVVPFTRIRRLTAQHMVDSKAVSAHTLMVKEVDYERVELIRRSTGGRFKEEEGFGLSYLPFNAVAAIEALREFPHLNASVGIDELIVHRTVNLGIAVDLDNEGLVVPVITDANRIGLREIARAVHDLATRARTKKLGADELAGGTFTITNPGPFGTLLTGAIINQPQVAILSTDGVVRKPVVVASADGSEAITIHSVGLLALTFDHRAVDGAYVARFLKRMAEILNTREWESDLS
jgi:pyruvate dehydrogenase E2 component (dihydrolipoamide acetyltransferase)